MKLCFILGAGRSGTTLVQSLLDCHPECTVWPFEISLRELWFEATEKAGDTKSAQCRRSLVNGVLLAHDRVKKLGRVFEGSAALLDTTGFDRERFIDNLRRDEDTVDTPLTYIKHLGESFRWDDRQRVFVVRHNEPSCAWYHESIPDSSTVITLRDPVENYLAYQRFRMSNGRNYIQDLPIGILTQFAMRRVFQGFRVAEGGSGRNIVVRLEDIASSPEEQMNRVADKCGIARLQEWRPSVLGKPFWGNSTRGRSNRVQQFATGYKRVLSLNEYSSFKRFEGMFTKYYPGAFDGIEVVSDRAAIERLFRFRYADAISTRKSESIKWYHLRTNLKLKVRNKFHTRLSNYEVRSLINVDALLPYLAESRSWREMP